MPTQKAGWGTALLVIFILVMTIFGSQIMHKIDFGTPKATHQLQGDWLGAFTLNGLYKPDLYGATSGPHTNGTLFLHLYRTSPNLDWVEGTGELCLNGEPVIRSIKISIDHYNDDGSFQADFYTDPTLGAFPWQATVTTPKNTPATLTLGNHIELAIQATLHPGTRAAFRAQSPCAQPPEKD